VLADTGGDNETAVQCDTGEHAASERHVHVAAGTEQHNAMVAVVSDDEFIKCGAHDAAATLENACTDMALELAVNTEHAHTAIAAVRDGDVTAVRQEAYSTRILQLTIATTFTPEATHKSAVTPVEHTDAMALVLRHSDNVSVDAHPGRIVELTHAHE
jgi:hypothetical protein